MVCHSCEQEVLSGDKLKCVFVCLWGVSVNYLYFFNEF